MKKVFAVFALLACVCTANLFAQEIKAGSVKAPGKGKVVIVVRASFKNAPDLDSYKTILKYSDKVKAKDTYYNIDGTNQHAVMEAPLFFTAKVEKDGTVNLGYFKFMLCGNYYDAFTLPLGVTVHVPEGASYVYIGNFNYDVDYALRVKGFAHYDEFDKAQKWINTAVGTNCDLVRAEIEFKQ